MTRFLRDGVAYGLVSSCALAVDMGLLFALVQLLHWGYLAAASVSFLAGASVAYLLSVRFVFTEHRFRSRSAEFSGFMAIGALGAAVNSAVMVVAVRYFELHYIMAKCLAAAFTFGCNFLARRQILFVRRAAAQET